MKTLFTTVCVALGLMAGMAQAEEYASKGFEQPPSLAELKAMVDKGWKLVSVVPVTNNGQTSLYIAYFSKTKATEAVEQVVFCNNTMMKYCFPRTEREIAMLTIPLSKCSRTSYNGGDFNVDDPTEFLTSRNMAQHFDRKVYQCTDYEQPM